MYTSLYLKAQLFCILFPPRFAGNEVITINTPAFAESVTEGDVRWEKGMFMICLTSDLFEPYWLPQRVNSVFLSRLIAVGDTVREDEVVCEIETDKVKDEKWTKLFMDSLTIIVWVFVVERIAMSVYRRQCRCPLRLQEWSRSSWFLMEAEWKEALPCLNLEKEVSAWSVHSI